MQKVNISRVLLMISFLILTLYSFSQKNELFKLICNDVKLTKEVFNNNVTNINTDSIETIVQLKSVDTIIYDFLDGVRFDLYRVTVNFNDNFIISPISPKSYDGTYFVARIRHRYIRLFGFYTSDVALIEDIEGKTALYFMIGLLEKSEVLNKKEAKNYKKMLQKRENLMRLSVNMPTQFLKLYYSDEELQIRSVILPVRPLRPIII